MSNSDILSQVNAARSQVGAGQLSNNSKLQSAAQMKAEDMATRNYFAHTSPDGKTPWDLMAEVGYAWSWAGENLAVSTDVNSVSLIVNGWLNSPEHRQIMLDSRYTETGIGVAVGTWQGQTAIYAAEEFGLPKTVAANSSTQAYTPATQAAVATRKSTTVMLPPSQVATSQSVVTKKVQPIPQNVQAVKPRTAVVTAKTGASKVVAQVISGPTISSTSTPVTNLAFFTPYIQLSWFDKLKTFLAHLFAFSWV